MTRCFTAGVSAILVILLLVHSACKSAEFEPSNLIASPAEIVAGESAAVSIDVTNTGGAQGTYLATLMIDSVESDHQEVTVGPGETRTVSFAISRQEPGTYAVDVNGMTTSLRVLRPAEFVVEDLTVSPQEVEVGEEATVSVDVRNAGEVTGTCRLVLKVDGTETATREVSVDPDATQNVTLETVAEEPGIRSIDVNGLASTLKVLRPAEFTIGGLTISPPVTVSGSSTTVGATVTNTGEVSGDYHVRLTIGGRTVEEKRVTVGAGATRSVSFQLVQDELGSYQISVNGLTGALKVIHPEPGWTDWGLVNWGDEYEPTPGTRIDLVPRGAGVSDQGPYVVYELQATGLPTDKVYQMWYRGLYTQTPVREQASVIVASTGRVLTGGRPVTIILVSYAKGACFEVGLMTEDRSIQAYGKVIPYSLEVSQAGYRLCLELGPGIGGVFFLWGEGFEPYEEVRFTSTSDDEVLLLNEKCTANLYGHIGPLICFPAQTHRQAGVASQAITGKKGQIKISHEWGPQVRAAAGCLLPRTGSATRPTVDGTITAGEWDTAFKTNFTIGVASGPVTATILAVHDGTDLYMAVAFAHGSIGPDDQLVVSFDNDGAGGARIVGDDAILLWPDFTDSFVESVGSTPAIGASTRPDTADGGQANGTGSRSTDGTYTTYEFRHPLDSSDDAHDFSLQSGDEFGFTITLKVGPVFTSYPSGWMIQTDDYLRLWVAP